jgi:hypothetical protein
MVEWGMDIFLVNEEHEQAESLSLKLSGAKDQEIVKLTGKEMELYRSDDFQVLRLGSSDNQMITEIKPGGSYIFVCDETINIHDVMYTIEALGIEAGIIRKNA